MKHCEVYRACRDVVRAEKDAPDKSLYRKQHQAEYHLHDVTLKELAEFGIHKLPSAEKLQRQQLELEEELVSAKKEKQDLQKQQKTLQVIEHNLAPCKCRLLCGHRACLSRTLYRSLSL